MPVEFLEGLGRVHGESVRVVDVEGVVLPLGGGGVARGRQVFPRLEKLTCALGCDAYMVRRSFKLSALLFLTD